MYHYLPSLNTPVPCEPEVLHSPPRCLKGKCFTNYNVKYAKVTVHTQLPASSLWLCAHRIRPLQAPEPTRSRLSASIFFFFLCWYSNFLAHWTGLRVVPFMFPFFLLCVLRRLAMDNTRRIFVAFSINPVPSRLSVALLHETDHTLVFLCLCYFFLRVRSWNWAFLTSTVRNRYTASNKHHSNMPFHHIGGGLHLNYVNICSDSFFQHHNKPLNIPLSWVHWNRKFVYLLCVRGNLGSCTVCRYNPGHKKVGKTELDCVRTNCAQCSGTRLAIGIVFSAQVSVELIILSGSIQVWWWLFSFPIKHVTAATRARTHIPPPVNLTPPHIPTSAKPPSPHPPNTVKIRFSTVR